MRVRLLVFAVCLVLAFIIFCIYGIYRKETVAVSSPPPPVSSLRPHHRKKVLFYTRIYGENFVLNTHFGASPSVCQYQCDWTTKRSEYHNSDAVIFSLRNFVWQKDFVIQELPARRDPQQVWAFFAIEPQGFFYPDQLRLLKDKFNLSISFQSDSGISVPLGVTRTMSAVKRQRYEEKDYMTGKRKLVAWMVGNCITGSRREKYVEQLKKYIDVDVYGGCGNQTHEENTNQDFRVTLAQQYLFYLAFENSDCDDYITEKFWVNLRNGMIPVVRGHRVNYRKYAPPNSFIHANAFSGPKPLAEYLKKLASNKTLFNSYHAWRKTYEIDHSAMSVNKKWVCDFCQKLYEMPNKMLDVYEHFSEDTRCFTHLDGGVRNRTGERIQDLEVGPMLPEST